MVVLYYVHMRYNIVFVGSVGAGKTSLIRKYQSNSTEVTSTLAVDFIPLDLGDFRVSVWDTCGQERFMSITSSYFARGHVFVLVHDISDSDVSEDLKQWYNIITAKASGLHDPVVVIVSNKTDIHPFAPSEVTSWVKEHTFDHIYTSAKSGEGIENLFSKIHDAIAVHQAEWLSPSLPALPSEPVRRAPGCSC